MIEVATYVGGPGQDFQAVTLELEVIMYLCCELGTKFLIEFRISVT